jgi:hypothetical protein
VKKNLHQVIPLLHIYRSLKILLKIKGNEISAKALNESATNYLQKQNHSFIQYTWFSGAMLKKVSFGICTKIKCYKKE